MYDRPRRDDATWGTQHIPPWRIELSPTGRPPGPVSHYTKIKARALGGGGESRIHRASTTGGTGDRKNKTCVPFVQRVLDPFLLLFLGVVIPVLRCGR